MGIVLGLIGAFALTRLLQTMLFGIGVTDVPTFAAAPLGMMLVVLLATCVPALRATRISPVRRAAVRVRPVARPFDYASPPNFYRAKFLPGEPNRPGCQSIRLQLQSV
jgi:hypothetical protein